MDETLVKETMRTTTGKPVAGGAGFSVPEMLKASVIHKKLIGGVTMTAAALAAAVAFIIPPSYVATATLLPPQQAQSGAAALLSQLGGAAGMVAGATGLKSPSELYVGMLKSRTIADELVKRMNLLDVYDTKSSEKAREKLKKYSLINSGKEGLITISVEDHDRTRAAQIANTYVDALTKLSGGLALTEAAQRRLFFEKQLEGTKDKLASAELAMKRGLNTTGVISVDADSRAMVETTARLRARISSKEVEMRAMRSFVTENNADFKRAEAELDSLRRELSALENGRPSEVDVAADSGRKSGLDSIRLLRDVKYQQMLYEMLAKQYEVARLDEARESSVIQVLDPAVAPEKKAKPARAAIILVATIFALAASVGLCYWMERRKNALGLPQARGHWKEIVGL